MEAIEEIENIVDRHAIECDFKRVDGIIYAVYDESRKDLEKEAGVYEKLGIEGGLSRNSLKLPFETSAGLVMKNQAEFHPLKFLRGIIDVLRERGVKIYEHTRAETVDGDRLSTTEGLGIDFGNLVIATHFPFLDIDGLYFNSF